MEKEIKKRIGALLVLGIFLAMIWVSAPVTAPGSDGDWNIDGENLEMGYSGADSEGDVGIGTATPSSKLEVDGDVELTNLYDNNGSNFFDGGAVASETVTGISSTGALQTASISISESQVTGEIESVTAGSGLTGGGTSGDVTLDIGAGDGIDVYSGSIAVDVTDILGTGLRESGNNIGVYSLMAVDGSHVNTVYVDGDGEVGIGTTNPTAGLHIRNTPYEYSTQYGEGVGSRAKLGVHIQQDLTAGAHGDVLTALYINSTFDSGPYVDVEHYGLIVESGKVGIGTAFPTVMLEVNGSVMADSFIGIYSPTGDTDMGNNLITNIGHANTDFTSGGGLIVAGNVGINTTNQTYALEVVGDVWLNSDLIKMGSGTFWYRHKNDAKLATDDYRIIMDENKDTTDAYFSVERDEGRNEARGTAVELMRCQENGNVGIATAAPTQKLHVNGSVRIEEAIYDNNNDPGDYGDILMSTGSGIEWADGSLFGQEQDLWETIESVDDSTSTAADSPTDTLYFDGYGLATVTIDGDTVNITVDEDAGKQNLLEVYEWEGSTGNDVELSASTGDDIRFYNDEAVEMLFLNESTGRIGIGTITPLAKLHVNGGGVLATGTTGSTPVSGAGTRLMWVPAKAAFRAGTVSGTQWDNANIGSYSVAMGYDTIASNNYATVSGGYLNTAGGQWATVSGGSENNASGQDAVISGGGQNLASSIGGTVSGGYENIASGTTSVVSGGQDNVASGTFSTVCGGYDNNATDSYAIVLGGYDNKAGGTYSAAGGKNMHLMSSADRTFVWGYSDSVVTIDTSDAFIIYSGNVGIGTVNPTGKLDVNGNDIRIRNSQTITNSSDDGYTGEIAWDSSYIYVCTNGDGPGMATDTWERVAISTW